MWNKKSRKPEYSREAYVNQLIRPGYELYPSPKAKLNMAKMLRQQGIFVGKKNQSNEVEDLNKEIVEYENYLTT